KIAFKELQNQSYIRYDDLPLETSDGRCIDVEFVSNIYLSDQEQVIQCNIRDITERKRADRAALRISDERYLALFEYAPDGILIADRQSRYIDANPSICRMLGYSRDELIGLNASDIVAPSEVGHIDSALASIIETADYHREWQFRRKDGSIVSAEVIATAMPDGNLLAMIRDVTERNRADAAHRRTEERVQFVLQSAHIGIWDMDCVSGALQWSDVMEAQHGLPSGAFDGTFETAIEHIHPDDRASVQEIIANAMKTGSDFDELHRTIRDGKVRWLSGAGRILLDERGEPLRAVGISQDVTERHTLEAQFQQAQKMEAVGRLAGGVAHDFNNLLTVILGFCELLLDGVGRDDPHRFDITEIQKAGTRAAALTMQLLAFSRKQIIELKLLDLNTILDGMRPMLGRLIREDVKILMGLRPRLGCVKADRGQVEQVILNLAVNAQDAMPNGGTLTIETANIELDEHYAAMHSAVTPGPHVVLTVTDSGVGMSTYVAEHLFEPFFTTKPEGQGTGLGLATVHGIAMRSGGSVNVYSEVGRGSSFKVYFPRVPQETTSIDTPAALPQSGAGTETVLVVEDADALRELTRRLLSTLGYTVLVAANADQATKLFDENPAIDVLLTDVVMPGPSGPDLSQQLMKRRPWLKVVYMSGYTDEAIVQHGVLQPGIAFLHKPFTAGALGRKIREALDRG
ncbi:MAG: PAS domain S-box protein, partial [Candidatus Saccharimonas sp.]|nr:PAS domain S-box protein [Planctomycetaceae bacterium]